MKECVEFEMFIEKYNIDLDLLEKDSKEKVKDLIQRKQKIIS